MALINIGIAGCLGRMGKELIKETLNDNRLNLVGGFEIPQHESINKKFSDLIGVNSDHKVSDDPSKIIIQSDVIIDFTTPQATLQNVLLAVEKKIPMVIGTTGLDYKIIDTIKKCSETIPILQSPNMSLGVNLLFDFIQQVASVLQDKEYDIEIGETHHKHKVDAPSGTAISFGQFAAKGRKRDFDEIKVFDRINLSLKRKTGDIGFTVKRGGEIAGEHTISFIGKNDRIDLEHKAFNRSIFVKGAIEAAVFVSSKKNGLYSIKDIIRSK